MALPYSRQCKLSHGNVSISNVLIDIINLEQCQATNQNERVEMDRSSGIFCRAGP